MLVTASRLPFLATLLLIGHLSTPILSYDPYYGVRMIDGRLQCTGEHAMLKHRYLDDDCYPNCDRPLGNGPGCTNRLFNGHKCQCMTGYIFRSGATGDCVRRYHCHLPVTTTTSTTTTTTTTPPPLKSYSTKYPPFKSPSIKRFYGCKEQKEENS